jgi:hypothetical protein
MISHSARVFALPAVCTLGLVACSSGPIPRDAEWTRWGPEAIAEDSNERGFLMVAGKDGRVVGDDQLTRIPASIPHERRGRQFVVMVPVLVGGIAERRYTRQVLVGRWAYDSDMTETPYWVKDGEPLPEGVPASAAADRPGTDGAAGERSGTASMQREFEVTVAVLVRLQGSDDPRASLPPMERKVMVAAGKATSQSFAFDVEKLRALMPTGERGWFEIEVTATCSVGGAKLACRVKQEPALSESEVLGTVVGSAAVP